MKNHHPIETHSYRGQVVRRQPDRRDGGWKIALSFLFGLGLVLSATNGVAQTMPPATVIFGDSFPPDPADPTWLYNTTTHDIYVFHGGTKRFFRTWEYLDIYACHGWVVLRGQNSIEVASSNGAIIFSNCNGVHCSAEVFGFWSRSFAQFEDHNGDAITLMRAGDDGALVSLEELSVQGQTAFCLPMLFALEAMYGWPDLRCWGILGSDGRWLIEPIYDHPFKFVDGVAEVMYKGEPRRINEQGALIDE